MSKRKGISTKTRFEIFKRDGFVCQYCGAHPPAATLHVDHIVAVANGGAHETHNFTTACDQCNFGKGARDLTVVPLSLRAKAALVAEREAQLRGYYEVMEQARQRLDDDAWIVIRALDSGADNFRRDWILSIKRFIENLGLYEVLQAAEIARANYAPQSSRQFRYFCGICWNKIREGQNG